MQSTIPWVEKYRPITFDSIVLSNHNRVIMENIVKTGNFPNTLFYGPPGTGKTTAIVNLIKAFQKAFKQESNSLIIHLNASDERGIEVIRSQINSFVAAKSLFVHGVKFVVLDEVDYMTKNAQQALRYLIHGHSKCVRFCLICNYASKIDESLQSDLMKLRFNGLPHKDIRNFLKNISDKEGLKLKNNELESLRKCYSSDLRSMVNHMQINLEGAKSMKVINDDHWKKLTTMVRDSNSSVNEITLFCEYLMSEYGLDSRGFCSNYVHHVFNILPELFTRTLVRNISNCIHTPDPLPSSSLPFFIEELIRNWRCAI